MAWEMVWVEDGLSQPRYFFKLLFREKIILRNKCLEEEGSWLQRIEKKNLYFSENIQTQHIKNGWNSLSQMPHIWYTYRLLHLQNHAVEKKIVNMRRIIGLLYDMHSQQQKITKVKRIIPSFFI